ncbi:hypothetical protein GIS00_18270 [Nakamurella sp. YIM 132087]|uniref:Uncharacterized protein n=1 Tax=Nakamurella alba TaxID=2665158 RepID=A0A7K1FSS0_9ACTN|nr:hypothetical protein [Nakamurella alba]MTD15884.1 hypothetical protein [Nakamurella alba]
MSTMLKSLRNRRELARTRRAVDHAISTAVTPGMRDELIVMSQVRHAGLR